jgi:imidazolonepropionase-like amidohydrolase
VENARSLSAGLAAVLLSQASSGFADVKSSDQPQGLRRNPPPSWVLQEADVVPRSGVLSRDMLVLIRDDRIEAVGKNLPVSPGARIANLKGKSVYAGLIDLFTEQPVTNPDSAQATANAVQPNDRRLVAELTKQSTTDTDQSDATPDD